MLIPATLEFPQINPFVFRIGNVGLSWYALMYVIGFTLGFFILRYRYRHGYLKLSDPSKVSLLVTYCFYGLILGARIFYVLFYNFDYYVAHPIEIPAIWHGGMSFHGGFIGVLIAMGLFARREKLPYFYISDNVGLCAPPGLFFGRLGNFINGELYGRTSDVAWAMVFPRGGPLPRHPSQLYEAFFEGLILTLILFGVASRRPKNGTVSALLVLGYGAFRFFVEFFREPDAQLGYYFFGKFTMGQFWCVVMVLAGLILLAISRRQPRPAIALPDLGRR